MYKTLKKALLPDYPRRVSVKKYFFADFLYVTMPLEHQSLPGEGTALLKGA